jgi:hypothetical protein
VLTQQLQEPITESAQEDNNNNNNNNVIRGLKNIWKQYQESIQ